MSDSVAIVQAFAELRYGAVVRTRENSVKYGHNLGQTLYGLTFLGVISTVHRLTDRELGYP